jgi:WD40 repeat protein
MRLDHMLANNRMPDPHRIWALDPLSNETFQGRDAHSTSTLWWAWQVRDGIHLLTMYKEGTIRIWNLSENSVVAMIDLPADPVCWDHSVDEEGFTLIIYCYNADQ